MSNIVFAFLNPLHANVSSTFFERVSRMMVRAFEERCQHGPSVAAIRARLASHVIGPTLPRGLVLFIPIPLSAITPPLWAGGPFVVSGARAWPSMPQLFNAIHWSLVSSLPAHQVCGSTSRWYSTTHEETTVLNCRLAWKGMGK